MRKCPNLDHFPFFKDSAHLLHRIESLRPLWAASCNFSVCVSLLIVHIASYDRRQAVCVGPVGKHVQGDVRWQLAVHIPMDHGGVRGDAEATPHHDEDACGVLGGVHLVGQTQPSVVFFLQWMCVVDLQHQELSLDWVDVKADPTW